VVKAWLSREGIEFSVRNVVTDPRARDEFLRAGFRLPPVTVIDGVPVEGFQPQRLEELLWHDRGERSPKDDIQRPSP
jgi:glutaredoxin 3